MFLSKMNSLKTANNSDLSKKMMVKNVNGGGKLVLPEYKIEYNRLE